MTDEASLLRAVLQFPAEDTPRLMYADWLQEHGRDERAEFIRVQCELARRGRIGTVPPSRRRARAAWDHLKSLEARERELWDGNARRWRADELGWIGKKLWAVFIEPVPDDAAHPHFTFRRGFVSTVTCTSDDWLANGDAITAAHPVENVVLSTGPNPHVPEFNTLRSWRKPLAWGGDVLWSLEAEWPGITFELPAFAPL